ncbi:MAG: SDR family oxidoreductase [Firmicutes bacterium]|nr:SDR family oxidoreductase [Bacillota bacterium]
MKALITGASSGIGLEIAKYLDSLDYELILVARDKEKLESFASTLKNKAKVIVMDLLVEANVKSLYVLTKNEDIEILVNNAGFGDFGTFSETELSKELEMIDLNIKAVHILTKMFLKDMKKKNKGYILNVASSAAFQPGPLMATYYSTKAYVLRLTEAVSYELKKEKSNVKVSCLCPGPVETNFNNVAGVRFSVKPLKADYVAQYAINKMFKNKLVIIPGFKMRCARFFGRFLSDKKLMSITYKIQKKKNK